MAKYRGRIQWNENQTARLENAVAAFNKQLDEWQRSGNYSSLPVKADLDEIRSRISNRDQLARMVRKLQGAAKPTSAKPVTFAGETIPQWQRRQISAIKAATTRFNRGVVKVRNILYPDFAKMSKVEQITVTDGKNLREVPLPSDAELLGWSRKYKTPYNLSDADYLLRLGETVKASWNDAYSREVYDIIKELVSGDHELAIRLLLESDLDPLRIDWYYENSADKTPFVTRRANIMQFWRKVKADFINGDYDPRDALMRLREDDYSGRYTYV